MKRVALIINFLNPEKKYMYKCINSLLNQSYKNFYIFFIDNNSKKIYKKNILLLLKKKRFKNFYYYRFTKTFSLPRARNLAINFVLGKNEFDYINFCDSDDWWSRNWLKFLLKKTYNSDLIFSDGFEIRKDEKKGVWCSLNEHELIKRCSVYIQSMLLSTDFLRKIKKKNKKIFNELFDISYDYDFLLKHRNSIKYLHIRKKLFNYNKLSSSISSKNLIKIILQWEQIRKSNKIKNFLLFHRKSLVRLIKIF